MRKLFPVVLLLLLAAALYLFLNRGPHTPAELASYLPNKDGTLLYADVDAMRRSGVLSVLAGAKAAEDTDYKDFVQQTGFDYRHDLDRLAATFRGGQVFFVVQGRFDWDKFAAYALKHGGSCKSHYCVTDSSTPRRRVSFYKLGSRLMGLAISPDDMAAYQVTRNASKANPFTPDAPVWMLVPPAVLKDQDALPAGLRSFALAMQGADRVVLAIAPEADHLKLVLDVRCPSVDSASALLVQLESTTNMLRKLLQREHQEPNPADLSGVLVAGTFQRDDRRVLGSWPIQKVFVDAIAGGGR
ncbi:MAG: hypothetical protein JO022_09515 [Acidobacteriaceae bacterium]|nr:hypothetical protein [Acidobacteriaceae bacterium]